MHNLVFKAKYWRLDVLTSDGDTGLLIGNDDCIDPVLSGSVLKFQDMILGFGVVGQSDDVAIALPPPVVAIFRDLLVGMSIIVMSPEVGSYVGGIITGFASGPPWLEGVDSDWAFAA